MSIKNKSHIKENPAITRLKALSKRIQQYLKGECLPPHTDPRSYLNDVLNSLDFSDEGLEGVVASSNYKGAYEKALDDALEIKQEYLGLAKLPSCEIEPTAGLRDLLEWCIDSIGKIIIETANEQPSGKPVDEKSKKMLKPLSSKAAAVYELLNTLPEYKGMKGREIINTLEQQKPSISIDQSTLTKNIIPELRPYGVKNKNGAGYYISK